jgi:GntR family transcriptional regulator, negative regulator for fad regulon and positive regulator of fabA
MNNWTAPQRPALYAEQALVTEILNGAYPSGSKLPAERELAAQLGVTRPTLREALRRLESDGWLCVQQGKPTQVNDFWREGGLNLLSSLVRNSQELPDNFIPNLLEVRLAMAPAYTRAAIERSPSNVADFLEQSSALDDSPTAFASFDWKLHKCLAYYSNNPIYSLILNGFTGFYEEMGCRYFMYPPAQASSRAFYNDLWQVARSKDGQRAEGIARAVMQESIVLWQLASKGGGAG